MFVFLSRFSQNSFSGYTFACFLRYWLENSKNYWLCHGGQARELQNEVFCLALPFILYYILFLHVL